MNIWDILILAIVAAAVTGALLALRRTRKKGGCSCGCEGCANTACKAMQNGGKNTKNGGL